MLAGLAVVAEVRRYAAKTLVTVQVESDWEIGPFLEAGAHTAFTRRVPPADISEALCDLLRCCAAGSASPRPEVRPDTEEAPTTGVGASTRRWALQF